MARTCSLCGRQDRQALDEAIRQKLSFRDIAGRFGTTKSAVQRHAAHVLTATAAASPSMEIEQVHAKTFLDELMALKRKAEKWLAAAEKADNAVAGAIWFREIRAVIETLVKVALAQRKLEAELPSVNEMGSSPAWLAMRTKIWKILQDFPEARAALEAGLAEGGVELTEQERAMWDRKPVSLEVLAIIEEVTSYDPASAGRQPQYYPRTPEPSARQQEEEQRSPRTCYRCVQETKHGGLIWKPGQVWDGSHPDIPEPPDNGCWEPFNHRWTEVPAPARKARVYLTGGS